MSLSFILIKTEVAKGIDFDDLMNEFAKSKKNLMTNRVIILIKYYFLYHINYETKIFILLCNL